MFNSSMQNNLKKDVLNDNLMEKTNVAITYLLHLIFLPSNNSTNPFIKSRVLIYHLVTESITDAFAMDTVLQELQSEIKIKHEKYKTLNENKYPIRVDLKRAWNTHNKWGYVFPQPDCLIEPVESIGLHPWHELRLMHSMQSLHFCNAFSNWICFWWPQRRNTGIC